MDKEKQTHKKSLGRRSSLPVPPPEPTHKNFSLSYKESKESTQPPDAIKYLMDYKEREESFLKSMKENCSELNSDIKSQSSCDIKETECENYIRPLLNTTGPSVVAALATHDAFEQLNKLHSLLYQFLTVKEQNDRMRRKVRDVELIYGLKKLRQDVRIIFNFFKKKLLILYYRWKILIQKNNFKMIYPIQKILMLIWHKMKNFGIQYLQLGIVQRIND